MPRTTNATFLYTHMMRWEPLATKNAQGNAWIKTLSKDEETGARTALIKYDPGFKQEAAVAEWPSDIYVLEGEMRCGSRLYNKGTFHYRPAGTEIGPIESVNGITRIIFTSDEKDKSSGEEIFMQDTSTMPWGPTYSHIDPTGEMGGTRKLREDPEQRVTIIIHGFWVPQQSLPGEGHRHDHQEEAFTLEGEFEDYLGDVNGHVKWVPGTYICRPPNGSLHGDTIKHVVPMSNIIRRGWVGDTESFHSSDANTRDKVPLVQRFSE